MSTSPLKRENAGKSKVADLRRQIELEYQAAYNALHAPAMIASHAFINARLSSMQEHREKLAGIVGEQQATELVMAVMEQTEEMNHEQQTCPTPPDQSTTL
jgi:hypothetical protein